jgi:hypothetical protein
MTQLTQQYIKEKEVTRESLIEKLKQLREENNYFYSSSRFDIKHLKKNALYKYKYNNQFLIITDLFNQKTYTFYRFSFDFQSLSQIII